MHEKYRCTFSPQWGHWPTEQLLNINESNLKLLEKYICRKTEHMLKMCSTVSYFGEAAAVLCHDIRVGAFQFLDDLKALVELGKDVHHRAGEESVLRRLLELQDSARGLEVCPQIFRNGSAPSYPIFFVSLKGSVHKFH